eukprot:gene1388-12008_t
MNTTKFSFSKVRQPRPLNTTYINQQLQSFMPNCRWKHGVNIFKKIQQNHSIAHITTYRKMVQLVGFRGKQVDKAREIFDTACQLKKSDKILYNMMIHSYSKLGNFQEAKKLFDEMKSKRLSPNSWTYVYLLKGYKNATKEEFEDLISKEYSEEILQKFYVKKQFDEIQKIFLETGTTGE